MDIQELIQRVEKEADNATFMLNLEPPESMRASQIAEQKDFYKSLLNVLQEYSNTKHGEILYKAVIPLEPRSKKNSLEIKWRKGKTRDIPFVSQSDTYKTYEKDCGYFLRRPKCGVITEKVNICYHFYRSNKIRIDQSNTIAALDDILVKYNIIKDDNFLYVCGHDGSTLEIDPSNPRTEIIIQRWK